MGFLNKSDVPFLIVDPHLVEYLLKPLVIVFSSSFLKMLRLNSKLCLIEDCNKSKKQEKSDNVLLRRHALLMRHELLKRLKRHV